jgi:hypothetical protein
MEQMAITLTVKPTMLREFYSCEAENLYSGCVLRFSNVRDFCRRDYRDFGHIVEKMLTINTCLYEL